MDSNLRDHFAILHLDILGFENSFAKNGLSVSMESYRRLAESARFPSDGVSCFPQRAGSGEVMDFAVLYSVRQSYFSDSLLFWISYSPQAMWGFLETCSEIVCKCLELRFAIRGALSVGEAYLDPEGGIFLGSPLIESSRLHKTLNWIGVAVGRSFAEHTSLENLPSKSVLPYRNHMKFNADVYGCGLTLDWPSWWRRTRLKEIRHHVASLDDDVMYGSYYRNTIEFIDHSATYCDEGALKCAFGLNWKRPVVDQPN